MPAKKSSPAEAVTKPAHVKKVAKQRTIKQPTYRSFKLSKRIRTVRTPLPSVFVIMKESRQLLQRQWKLFAAIALIYLLLTLVLVKGLNVTTNLGDMKTLLQDLFTGNWGKVVTGFTLFGMLVGGATNAAGEAAATYQSFLLVIMSLVIIWALRQSFAGTKVSIRDAFYKSMYPFVPFLLVLFVIGVQLLPLVLANFLYGVMFAGGVAVTPVEQVLWGFLIFLLCVWSLYMISASIFALYMVTLPDVRPVEALRKAGALVQHRRWVVMRKVLFLPLLLVTAAAVIMIPLVLFATSFAPWVFLALTMVALVVAHAYLYTLYRKLL